MRPGARLSSGLEGRGAALEQPLRGERPCGLVLVGREVGVSVFQALLPVGPVLLVARPEIADARQDLQPFPLGEGHLLGNPHELPDPLERGGERLLDGHSGELPPLALRVPVEFVVVSGEVRAEESLVVDAERVVEVYPVGLYEVDSLMHCESLVFGVDAVSGQEFGQHPAEVAEAPVDLYVLLLGFVRSGGLVLAGPGPHGEHGWQGFPGRALRLVPDVFGAALGPLGYGP